ncbi:MAG: hypothetical protein GY835_23300 [bacterium]|nr:hypothetical protein [bacterium]
MASAGYTMRQLIMNVGFEVLQRMLKDDREERCGPARKWQGDKRVGYRYGYDQAQVGEVGGSKVSVPKPRVRSVADKELELPTWSQMSQEVPLVDRVLEQILVGGGIQNDARSLEPLPERTSSVGLSRSSVSRRFVTRTRTQVQAFLARPLDEVDYPVVLIDGTHMGDHVVLVALGIEATGRRQVLGITVGSDASELSEVKKESQSCRVERGPTILPGFFTSILHLSFSAC